ncbi:uncharacterized protein JCM6883_000427 [Sporobolomyces salmoneus]|uniref:uncharacterized protein n=1 Tax=Sporobolomyces salmoneus TaxID=183962 RepID=UPI00317BFF0A
MSTTQQLESLLQPPSAQDARSSAQQFLINSLPPASSRSPHELGQLLSDLLQTQQSNQARLSKELEESEEKKRELLIKTRNETSSIRSRVSKLKQGNTELRQQAKEIREQLVGELDGPVQGGDGEGDTLRDRLKQLSTERKQLEGAKLWFSVIVKAEELGLTVLRSLEENALPPAFRAYVGLVDYIKLVYKETDQTRQQGNGNGMVALTSHLVGMANSVWNSLVKVLSTRLLSKLEALGWPTPFAEPLDPFEDPKVAEFQTAFVDLLTLELLQNNNVLPNSTPPPSSTSTKKPKPLLALVPLVHPLLLRFKWQFDGSRSTNRIDKPEYPLSHVLNLLTAHERFLSEDIQYLLSMNGFDHLDALNEFTSLLLPPLSSRLRHHLPQLVQLPPVLAHTVYQVVEFDQVLRGRGFRPRRTGTRYEEVEERVIELQKKGEDEEEWEGLSEVILGRREWLERWLDGEREFFDTRYYSAIGAQDAWQILSPEDYDITSSSSGTRPTQSALRIKELSEQLSQRYRPLPLKHTLPFLLTLHLPMLQSYAKRITSSLDAFENLSLGSILPGALVGTSNAATQGVGGVLRLVRAGVSARWMSERCEEWGEDAFFLHLYEYLQMALTQGKIDDPDHNTFAEEVIDNSDGTLFDREKKTFEDLADRSEELIVRHCTREVLGELKPYLSKRFDRPSESDSEPSEDLSVSPELITPLSLLSSLLSALVASYPPATLQSLYRRISHSLSQLLFERLYLSRNWTVSTVSQLSYDLSHGFLSAGREAGIPQRGLKRGWELALGATKVVGLPTTQREENSYEPSSQWVFAKVMQVTWDDEDQETFGRMMEDLGVGEVLDREEVKSLMRKREECWR